MENYSEENSSCGEVEVCELDSRQASETTFKRKRYAYSIERKIEILDFAKQTSIIAASKHFKVDRNSVRDWRKQEQDLRKM